MAPPSRTAQKAARATALAADKAKIDGKPQADSPGGYAVAEVKTCEIVSSEGPSAEDVPIVLAEEVVPAGKHQGKAFQDVVADEAFCKWLMREPRSGWMGMLKVYL